MTNPYDTYTSPLATRNASAEMLRIWSPRHKFTLWRKIWLAVAMAQKECGLQITDEQIAELQAHVEVTDEDIRRAEELEKRLRHDVMAHVHAYGDVCPKARPIIHLGMTSQDVNDNADSIIIEQSRSIINRKIALSIVSLARRSTEFTGMPTLGFTHYQPAQPTTVGRRMAGWASDLALVHRRLWDDEWMSDSACLERGLRGATGSQASYLALFDGDTAKVAELQGRFIKAIYRSSFEPGDELHESLPHFVREVEALFTKEPALGFSEVGDWASRCLMGQTYPRVVDAIVLSDLASAAAVLHKIATDIRLLSNRKEIDEPFGRSQIGSSAMPYKRNPMRCERICGLSRFVMNLVGNAYDTAATQWLERTLDDSSNRRLSLPEAFLALDGALDLMHNVASGLEVHEAMVRRNLMAELPFMATENILMAAVKAGGDRQVLHERIRVHAQEAGQRVKDEGLDNDLIERLKADPAFAPPALKSELNWDDLMDPMKYVGRAVEQTERFIRSVVEPLKKEFGGELNKLGHSEPRV